MGEWCPYTILMLSSAGCQTRIREDGQEARDVMHMPLSKSQSPYSSAHQPWTDRWRALLN